jgi:ABC-type transporter Mla subunit MlaD
VVEHANGPNHPVAETTGVAVADHATARQPRKADVDMPDDNLKTAIDQIANSRQTVTLLSTQLRRELSESAQRAVELEAAADKAVTTIKQLRPRKRNR